MKIEIDEYIDNLAARYFVESLGSVPTENEALFTRIRVKRQMGAEAEIIEENGEYFAVLKINDIEFKEKDSLLEKYFISEWEKAYKKAIEKEVRDRLK